MDKLRNMRALVTVAKLGSFSAAAKALGVTPGMMSKQVRHLEDELDVRLLHRTTRGVSLTDAGELYVDRLVSILQHIEDADVAATQLASGPRGVLRISCPPSFGTHVLTPVIAAFMRENQGIRIELGLQDDEPDVIASRLDLIFRLGTLRDSSLVARQVGDAPFVLCASPVYVGRHGAPQVLADLVQHNCIVDGSIQCDGNWDFVARQRRVAQAVGGNFSSLSTEAVIEAAIEGLGVSYVPRYAVCKELQHGEIVEIELNDVEPISVPLFALYGSREHIAGKIRTFIDFYLAHSERCIEKPVIAASGPVRRAHSGPRQQDKSVSGERLSEDLAT